MTTTTDIEPEVAAPEAPQRARRAPVRPTAVAVLAVAAVATGVALRLWPRSALWLDEAQSVAFARLPLTEIPGALRQDGAPPLYYLLLHVWMQLVGDGDAAVRALSVLCSLAAVALLGVAAERLAGRRAAVAVIVLTATNPFAIRYATETRMYALVVLEAAIGIVLVESLARHPDRREAAPRVIGIAVVSAALLYTHYWAVYLLAAAAAPLVVGALQRRWPAARTTAWRVLVGITGGALLWLPWIPTFRFQARNTGTPWTRPARLGDATSVLLDQAGGEHLAARPLAWILGAGLVLAVGSRLLMAERRNHEPARTPAVALLGAVVVLCPLLAAIGGALSDSAFVARYSSVMFPALMLLAAIGLVALGPRWLQSLVIGAAAVFGLLLGVQESMRPRTPASAFASVLERQADPGDVIVYCPDQLGPALSRALRNTPVANNPQGVFPNWASPDRVDWIDYAARYQHGSVSQFATRADLLAGSHTIWLVWSDRYPATQSACRNLAARLSTLRPQHAEVVADDRSYGDRGALWRFDADG